jgi:hypothetical protein
MKVPMGEGQKFLNDPWNIQGFGEMDIRRKNAGKQRPSRDAGMAPQGGRCHSGRGVKEHGGPIQAAHERSIMSKLGRAIRWSTRSTGDVSRSDLRPCAQSREKWCNDPRRPVFTMRRERNILRADSRMDCGIRSLSGAAKWNNALISV